MNDQNDTGALVMRDLGAVFGIIARTLHFVAVNSSVTVGYGLAILAAALAIYRKRRQFYLDTRLDDDWEPSFGKASARGGVGFLLLAALFLATVFAAVVLWRYYLPDSFTSVFASLYP
jgi:hypothetical protein